MTIASINFAVLVALALGIYYVLPRKQQNYWLLLLSYVFVSTWDWRFAFVLAAITAFNYKLAQFLVRNDVNQRRLLWLGIGINLAILLFFRIEELFIPGFTNLLSRIGEASGEGALRVLIPIGISFYTLQNISYLVDVFRGQIAAETSWTNFALYVAYFPKLIAGPIERASKFLPQLNENRVVDDAQLARSFTLIFTGLIRKLLVGDILFAVMLTDVYQIPAKYTAPELLCWLVIYSFAIYNDFAGYTNIVRGVSGLFGIELSPNFATPYFSRSFAEFWQRWHISLSEWLRDYIYFPLTRALLRRNPSRYHPGNVILPPLVTMLVSGLWHGLSLHMLVWGGLHATYLIIERIIRLRGPVGPPKHNSVSRQALAMFVVFMGVTIAWIPFGWGFPAALPFMGGLLDWSSFEIRYRRMFLMIPIIAISLTMDVLQFRSRDETVYLKWPRAVRATAMALIIWLILLVSSGDFQQEFVYQAF